MGGLLDADCYKQLTSCNVYEILLNTIEHSDNLKTIKFTTHTWEVLCSGTPIEPLGITTVESWFLLLWKRQVNINDNQGFTFKKNCSLTLLTCWSLKCDLSALSLWNILEHLSARHLKRSPKRWPGKVMINIVTLQEWVPINNYKVLTNTTEHPRNFDIHKRLMVGFEVMVSFIFALKVLHRITSLATSHHRIEENKDPFIG